MENNRDVEIYISEIAERLWSGHASIMVGAGFSMNAQTYETSTVKFPSWMIWVIVSMRNCMDNPH
jgi:hypothetical protein